MNPYNPKPKIKRNQEILELSEKGLNNAKIGRIYGLTRQRVAKILAGFKSVDKSTVDKD